MEEKVSLPIKTKIAAWWMIVVGGFIIISGLWQAQKELHRSLHKYSLGVDEELYFFPCGNLPVIFFYLLLGLLVLFPSTFLLLRRKKWSWYWAIITLFVIISLSSSLFFKELHIRVHAGYAWEMICLIFLIFLIICLPPLILLLLDRKNFWKIAI